jgi:hypothetical protein
MFTKSRSYASIRPLVRFNILSAQHISIIAMLLQSFREKLDAVKHEMSYYEIPDDLQYRVQRHYDYMWLNERAFDEIKMLSDASMSKVLRTNIALHLYKDLLQKVRQLFCFFCVLLYYHRCPCHFSFVSHVGVLPYHWRTVFCLSFFCTSRRCRTFKMFRTSSSGKCA